MRIIKSINAAPKSDQLWYVHVDPYSLDPKFKTREPKLAISELKKYIKQSGVPSNLVITQVGYEDLTIETSSMKMALNVAKRLNKVLPAASKSWYDLAPAKAHNAYVAGPNASDGDPEPNCKNYLDSAIPK